MTPGLSQTTALRRLKILFTSTHLTSFIKEDLKFLEKHFDVVRFTTLGLKSIVRLPLHVRDADVTYTWFASVYSAFVVFFATMFGKKAVIVVGGVDVAKYPEINYGIWLSWWRSVFVRYAIRNADKILPVDQVQVQELKRLAEYDGGNLECVPTGYDAGFWVPSPGKENVVLTVAAAASQERLNVKGITFLFDAARQLHDIRFIVVGVSENLMQNLRRNAPPNVELVPFVERDELRKYYRRARVYCQPSFTEGLPNSVCEAMLCECIPVGTNVGGIPTAMGGHGFLVPYGDGQSLADAIRSALECDESVGRKAREHIASTFTLQRREKALLRIVSTAVQSRHTSTPDAT